MLCGTLLLASLLAAVVDGGPAPENLWQIECDINQLAFEYGVQKIPSAAQPLHRALRLDNCTSHLSAEQKRGNGIALKTGRDIRDEEPRGSSARGSKFEIFVCAKTGHDNNPGSFDAPFQHLDRAKEELERNSARRPAVVYLREGTYRLTKTLQLHGEAHSQVTWRAYKEEKATLSGGMLLTGLDWEVYKGNILVAKIPRLDNGSPPPPSMNDSDVIGSSDYPFHSRENGGSPCKCDGSSGSSGSKASFFQYNVAYMGGDIATVSAESPEDCCSQCSQLEGCAAWTLASGLGGTCWLKSATGYTATYSPQFISCTCDGAPPPAPPAPSFNYGRPPETWNALYVNGSRQVRARYPNGDPHDLSGQCFAKAQFPGEGCSGWLRAGKQGSGFMPPSRVVMKVGPIGPSRANSTTFGCEQCDLWGRFSYDIFAPPEGHPVYNKPLRGLGWGNNSYYTNYLESLMGPSSFDAGAKNAFKRWKNPGTGVVHMMHTDLWGSVQYRMTNYSITEDANVSISLGYGGYQNRPHTIEGNAFYIENLLEELDAPGEWFFEESSGRMFLFPNITASSASSSSSSSSSSSPSPTPFLSAMQYSDVAVAVLDTLVSVKDANDVRFEGLAFTETRTTFMEIHQEPSGGWNVHRGGCFEAENVTRLSVSQCVFNETGGNAILLTGHVVDSLIEQNEILRPGESGILLWGTAQAFDGTRPTYPNRNTVRFNHIHEVGIFGKQTSCVCAILSANSTITDNVCYNGPRAGINQNDGFGGNDLVARNLVFNMVRESADHGPYNSWDHQVFLTFNGVDDGFSAQDKWGHGGASIIKAYSRIERNFFINGYNGIWSIDHDDGSQFYNDSFNFLVFGGCKNFQGNHKITHHNLIAFPGIDSRSYGDRRCQSEDNNLLHVGRGFAEQYYHDNHCLSQDGIAYSWFLSNTSDLADQIYHTWNNTFYAPDASFEQDIFEKDSLSFPEWQALGQDRGSKLKDLPTNNELVAMAKALLEG